MSGRALQPAEGDALLEQLERLTALRDSGALSEHEFIAGMHTAWSLWRRGGFSVFGARGFAGRGKPRKETQPSKLQIPTSNSSMLVPKD